MEEIEVDFPGPVVPSVCITRDQWDDELNDFGVDPYPHTDGQGIISKELRDRIWDALLEASPDKRRLVPKPSAVSSPLFSARVL